MTSIKLFVVLLIFFPNYSSATDTITPSQPLLDDNQTLISAGEVFQLGFFQQPNSENRFVGLWYKKAPQGMILWVANRDKPLKDESGRLAVTQTGNIVILNNQSTTPIWSSNSSATKPSLQLLSTGNLVLKDGGSGKLVWESFDHPCDTLISGMKLGWNLETRQNWFLSSWNSPDDPSTGNYTYEVDPRGLPQLLQRKGTEVEYRSGPWDGVRFGGDPPMSPNAIYKPIFVFNTSHVYYTYEINEASTLTTFRLNPSGIIEQFRWINERQEWLSVYTLQKDRCDSFGHCGPNGVCNVNLDLICHCPTGYVPKAPRDWEKFDWGSGCVPKTKLNCSSDMGFKKFPHFKLPYGLKFLVQRTVVGIEDCKDICSRNCSCMAYALSGVSGCMLWFDEDLLDMTEYNNVGGQDLYIKMAASELAPEKDGKRTGIIISVSVISVLLLLIIIGGYIIWKRMTNSHKSQGERMLPNIDHEEQHSDVLTEDVELPLFDLETIMSATDNLSPTNKIGEGGFGPVYKAVLPTGEEVAVKRLSKDSGQGVMEFKNEVILIAKLQHRNLVRLLGCCIHREERMLIYEYLPNKSLNLYLFDQTKGTALNWQMRFDIIVGIARGLLYLHRDSRLRIIHRDLKASNILLDNEMNPKISDFGLARIFGGDQNEVNTKRVVGTYGYMSPEYAIDGIFSVKSDVFSFGVMVLEILGGKKNRGFNHPDHDLNLLGHAWKLWNEHRPLELVDVLVKDVNVSEAVRCIQVGLLCVQKRPEERPLMSAVLFMLDSENPSLPQPKQPGFYVERVSSEVDSSSSWNQPYTSTDITVTRLQGRFLQETPLMVVEGFCASSEVKP
ncbi:G-type lectin S-receptor-like serine/threonine-protein kinase At4g27290 [Humulus lupulus]|uniref:G-type lectin S-receptor-like serine/threonine-protein kinase At4g27290 n=1 Tax=Humulus lupulus TaxID=3486 RepID=UPI002B411B8D|nr:G-type lectin S-receptor-like serine/threonine-protein kinase At4g27290 [Humulus lupulus]XP_062087405.1 G-type lectin S-receptor-like serine/threonine-protein kinase At4g27290 [Humulus lupulus]